MANNINITINDKKHTIEMDKTTSKRASQYGTDEYKALQEVRSAYPTYSVAVVNRKPDKPTVFCLAFALRKTCTDT